MEPQTASPFRKLKHKTYLVLEVLMFIDYQDALKFMFDLIMESRTFIKSNFIAL